MTTFILAIGGYGPDLINDVANQYVNAINTGFGLIKGDVTRLLNILIILSIMWSAALWALSDDHVIAIQVVMALLTFKFGSLAAFVLVPFAVLSKTAFIAERPLGWVVGSGVRLMVLTLVLGVGNNIFQSLKVPAGGTVTTYEAFCI